MAAAGFTETVCVLGAHLDTSSGSGLSNPSHLPFPLHILTQFPSFTHSQLGHFYLQAFYPDSDLAKLLPARSKLKCFLFLKKRFLSVVVAHTLNPSA